MKKKILQYSISTLVGAVMAVLVMNTEGLFFTTGYPVKTVMLILCDSFFVPGIFLTLFGALLWISTTGFFDSFGYAAHSIARMLLPFVSTRHKSYYDYKMAKEEKRGTSNKYLFIVGAGYLALSAVFLIAWYMY